MHRRSGRVRAIGVLLGIGLLSLALPAGAQVTTGSLVGSVKDASGQGLGGADIQITDQAHGVLRAAVTDRTGFYRFVDLPPSSYGIAVSAAGFRGVSRAGVTVLVDSVIRIDFELQLAGIRQSVDVAAAAQPLQTESAELGTVLDRHRLEGLPLNRRDFLQLSLLTPGVQGPVENSELSSRGGFAMHANGGREEFNDFLLDGVDNNDPYVNRHVVQPSVDSVQEVKIATNSYSAQYGRNAGGQVNVVTRRGSSRFEGFGYEYFRDRSLDARNYFEDGGQPFRRNQVGGGAGGPIVPDRTFFFGTVDYLRTRQSLSRLGTVPDGPVRTGNLAAFAAPVIDPFSGQPFAGNIIPAARISPVARHVLEMFPAANRPGGVNYLGQPVQRDDDAQWNARIDHRLSDAGRVTARYSDGRASLFEPYTEGTGVTAGFGDVVTDRTWNAMSQYEQAFGRAANALRFGATGFSRDLLTENHGTDVGVAWGVNWLKVPAEAFGYPIIDVAGYSRVGDAFGLPIVRDATTFQLADDVSIGSGRHLFKIGGDLRIIRLNSRVDLFSRGQLSFTGAFTGSGIGDLLLGLPTFGLQARSDNPIRMRTRALSSYLQDDWRIAPDVTLDLGLRYEYSSPPVDERDGMSVFDAGSGQLTRVGTNGVSRSGLEPDRNNIAPRAGVSWRLRPGLVARAGYGLFYDSGMLTVNTSPYFNPPWFDLRVFFPGAQGLLTLNDPFPLTSGFVPPPTLSTLSPDLVAGYLQHWNVAVEREVASLGTLTVAYAGSKGSHLIRPRDLNQPPPGPGDVQARRPYPDYANIFLVESEGSSRFDSLQAVFNRRVSRGASLSAVYTLSKSTDDSSAFLGTPADKNFPQNSNDLAAERAPSSFDVRHRVALTGMIGLPQGNPWTRGMEIQAVAVLRSGQPFTPILRFDNSNTGNSGGTTAGSDRPNVNGDPALANPTADRWFDTSVFSVAPLYTFGNAGRNGVRGPGYAAVDVSVTRKLDRPGRGGVTLALQVFNLLNRTNLDLPELFVDEPASFGKIFSAKAPRQIQLAARVRF